MSNAGFLSFVNSPVSFTAADSARRQAISDQVPGYSRDLHYAFFQHLLRATAVQRILVLGVYFGRDIAFMCDAATQIGRTLSIVGVDKFSDDFCDDWPEERKALNWQVAGFGHAPTLERAAANLSAITLQHRVQLVRTRDEVFLAECGEIFDLIYIDTSHDYTTVHRQLLQAKRLVHADGLIAGDDYSDEGTWGVRKAVSELAPDHRVFSNWIWLVTPQQVISA